MRDEGRQGVHYPQGNVLLRNLARDFPVVTHGQGVHPSL